MVNLLPNIEIATFINSHLKKGHSINHFKTNNSYIPWKCIILIERNVDALFFEMGSTL